MTSWQWAILIGALLLAAYVYAQVQSFEGSADSALASAFSGTSAFSGAFQNIGDAFNDLADTWSPLTDLFN